MIRSHYQKCIFEKKSLITFIMPNILHIFGICKQNAIHINYIKRFNVYLQMDSV